MVKVTNWILACICVFSVYASGIPGVNLGELLLVLLLLFGLFYEKKILINAIAKKLVMFCCYAALIIVLASVCGQYDFSYLHRFLRFILYICVAIITSQKLYDKETFFKASIVLAEILTACLIIQYILFYATGKYVAFYGFLPLSDPSRLAIDYGTIFSYEIFRPSALLTEPAACIQQMFVPLVYVLFNMKNIKRPILKIAILVVGMLLTKSLWGVALLALIFGYYFLLKKDKKLTSWIVLFFAIVAILSSGIFDQTLTRIDFGNLTNSASFTGRFGGYELLQNRSFLAILFGKGFGNIGELNYANSMVYLLSSCGIVGTLLFFSILIVIKKKHLNNELPLIALCFYALLFGSSIIVSTTISVIFTVVLFEFNKVQNCNEGLSV